MILLHCFQEAHDSYHIDYVFGAGSVSAAATQHNTCFEHRSRHALVLAHIPCGTRFLCRGARSHMPRGIGGRRVWIQYLCTSDLVLAEAH
jgi:hypothetical protein